MKVGQRIKRQVYLTEAEEKYVLLKAKEYGYNFSRMCRYALLHLDDTSAKKKIQVTTEHNILIEERQRQLAAIGNNINQIAHQVNIFAIDGKIPEQYVVHLVHQPAVGNFWKDLSEDAQNPVDILDDVQ